MELNDNSRDAMARPNRILVTGASGFIGGHITRFLADQGEDVTCFVRDSSDLSFISDLPVRIIKGDITKEQSIEAALKDIDLIIHTAAKVDDWGPYEEFYRTNVIGTLNVLKAAVSHSIDRVIITGSVSSYGEEHCAILKDETSPYNSHYSYFLDRKLPSGMNHYRDTKALCTQKAIEYAEQQGLNLIVMEPVWVYGENEFSSGFYEYLKTVRSGVFLMPGCRSNSFHVIYAGDLARAYYLAYSCNLNGIHRIILGNRSTEKMARIYELFCKEAGLRKPLLVPKIITYPVGFILELFCHLLRLKNPPVLTRARVNMFYDSIGYDTSKAYSLTGFESRISLEDGIGRTVKWYRDNNFI